MGKKKRLRRAENNIEALALWKDEHEGRLQKLELERDLQKARLQVEAIFPVPPQGDSLVGSVQPTLHWAPPDGSGAPCGYKGNRMTGLAIMVGCPVCQAWMRSHRDDPNYISPC